MLNVVIIGGGFAGLSSAVHLSKKNIKITLLEASPKLGGRAYSLILPDKDDVIDNGQHIMMGCYTDTLEFLDVIGASDKIETQENLKVTFTAGDRKQYSLDASGLTYPFNLIKAVLKYDALNFKEKLNVLKLFGKLRFINKNKLKNLTVREWLITEGQSENSIIALWEILAVGTLNSSIENAGAALFCEVLINMFTKGNKASTIILPATGLSEMYCEKSLEYVTANGGEVYLSERVESFKITSNKISEVKTNKRIIEDVDFVISAVPFYEFEKLFPDRYKFSGDVWENSPILSVHIWLKDNPFKERFYGMIDSEVHWIFNHSKHITLVVSNAEKLSKFENSEIFDLVCSEIEKYFSIFDKKLVTDYQVIKEKRATFIPTIKNTRARKNIVSIFDNLLITGDWTSTGLPATIEGTVKSGRQAADNILSNLS